TCITSVVGTEKEQCPTVLANDASQSSWLNNDGMHTGEMCDLPDGSASTLQPAKLKYSSDFVQLDGRPMTAPVRVKLVTCAAVQPEAAGLVASPTTFVSQSGLEGLLNNISHRVHACAPLIESTIVRIGIPICVFTLAVAHFLRCEQFVCKLPIGQLGKQIVYHRTIASTC
ncbi:MAG: hypothetical protein ACR2NP_12640, partial [Pirellulaceae bacterium]